MGGHLLGWRTICAVEFNAYARNILLARQRDGHLPKFPIWDDVRTFDGRPWKGHVDIISGGFPCQDISSAGRGDGIEGEKSGLWQEMARIINDVESHYVWIENSPMLLKRGFDVVLGDLSAMGYDATWGIVGAGHSGAPHERERIWILAHSNSAQRKGGSLSSGVHKKNSNACSTSWWKTEPSVDRMVDGLATRMDIHGTHARINVARVAASVPNQKHRLIATGNGQVPAAMVLAWNKLLSL